MSARPTFPTAPSFRSARLLSPDPAAASSSSGARWAAVLAVASAAWQLEAERLAAIVRDPVVTGPCAAALTACGDLVAGEIRSVATDLARCGADLRLARPA